MATKNFSLTLTSGQSPADVFQAITNVRAWWTGFYSEEITGKTEKLHDEFTFRAADGAHYTKQKLVEVVPDKRIVWLITHSNLSFLEQPEEWLGTKVIFDINKTGKKTELTFTHEGLTPEVECYDSCAPGWTQYLNNKLLPLIN